MIVSDHDPGVDELRDGSRVMKQTLARLIPTLIAVARFVSSNVLRANAPVNWSAAHLVTEGIHQEAS